MFLFTFVVCLHSELFKYTRDDLLIAIPGQTERLSLVEASRPWRSGVNTFIALEKPLKESDAPKGFLVSCAPYHVCLKYPFLIGNRHLLPYLQAATACMHLQSKTTEYKEHFGTFQDPHAKNEWEKAGDLR